MAESIGTVIVWLLLLGAGYLIGSAGWTEERLVERWRLLKREGAF